MDIEVILLTMVSVSLASHTGPAGLPAAANRSCPPVSVWASLSHGGFDGYIVSGKMNPIPSHNLSKIYFKCYSHNGTCYYHSCQNSNLPCLACNAAPRL